MAIKSIVESLEEVPEALHEDYEENEDGKYVLRKEAFEDHPAFKKLKGTLNTLDREKRDAQKKAQRFDALAEILPEDLDLTETDEERRSKAFQYLRGEIDFEGGTADAEAIEKVRQAERQKAEKREGKVREEADHYKGLFMQTVRDQAIIEAMGEAKILDPYRPAVKAMFRDKAKVEVGDDGMPAVLIDGEYGPQDFKSFLKEWAQTDEGKYFVQGDGNAGGGSRGSRGEGKLKNPWSNEHWSMREQGRIFQEDPERAKRMAAEHGKKVA